MKKALLVILTYVQISNASITKDLIHLWETTKQTFTTESLKKVFDNFMYGIDKANDRTYSKKLLVFLCASALSGATLALLAKKYLDKKPYNIFIITHEDKAKVIHHYEAKSNSKPIQDLVKRLIKESGIILKRSEKNIFIELKDASDKANTAIKQIAEHSKDIMVLRG